MGTGQGGSYIFGSFGVGIPDVGAAGGVGVKTDSGTFLPAGMEIAALVRSTGVQDGDGEIVRSRLLPTLAEALSQARSGRGDTILVLPGHTESVTDATMLDDLVSGTNIIGIGRGSMQPVFRWTNTAGQWTVDQDDVNISGLFLRLEGVNGVVKAINVTGADCSITSTRQQWASGATAKATIAVEVGTGADRFSFNGNDVVGTATHNVTNGVLVAAVVDQFKAIGNTMMASATAANGLINISVAATNVYIKGNDILNSMTVSTSCITAAAAASTGIISDNRCATINDGVATAQGIILGAGCLIRAFESYSSDEPALSGILTPVAAT